ncbi:hypothetical protein D3C84_1170440 [compost metagenome]
MAEPAPVAVLDAAATAGLVMVTTRAASELPEVVQPEPVLKGKRRREVVRQAEDGEAPVELVQVQTQAPASPDA